MIEFRRKFLAWPMMIALLALIAGTSDQAFSQEKPDPLKKLELSYMVELEKVTKPLGKSYQKALTSLQEKYKKSGDLEGALAVRDEKKRIEAGDAADSELSDDSSSSHKPLAKLQSIYREELIKARSKVDQLYIKALVKLEKDLTRQGELDGAIVVKEERKSIEAMSSDGGKEAAELRKFLTREWDRSGDHLFVEFGASGAAFHRWADHPVKLWAGKDSARAKWRGVCQEGHAAGIPRREAAIDLEGGEVERQDDPDFPDKDLRHGLDLGQI